MNSSKSLIFTLVCVFFFLSSSFTNAAVSCKDVMKDLSPCVKYLVTGSGMPPAECCQGVSALAAAAATPADKKAACECIKTATKDISPKAELAQALATNCGLNSNVNVSPNVDCSTIG